MSEDAHLEPILGESSTGNFRHLRTIPASIIHNFTSIIITVTGVIMHFAFPDDKRCEAYFIILYLRVFFYVFTLLFDHLVKYMHQSHKLFGYVYFHKETSVLRGLPFYIVSLWNAVIMGIQALMQHWWGNDFGEHCLDAAKSPLTYLVEFCILETCVLTFVHGKYIAKVRGFNMRRPEPDAMREMADVVRPSLGFIQRGADLAELLESQAELIEFYREQNMHLTQRIVEISNQVTRVTLPINSSSDT